VAVFPPPEVGRIALESARSGARGLGDRVRWTRPEYVHLTLKFLGEVPEGEIEQIGAALRKACADHAPFDASLSSFGGFPSARRARVIWAGTGAGSEELRSLVADVETAFEPLGFGREDRTFVPHATLGRARGKPVRLELPPVVPGEPGFEISRVELMESRLAAGGAVYETLHSLALRSGC
jgi:2'-5' RNA ligase